MSDNDKLSPRVRAQIFALVDQEQQASTLMRSTLRQIGELKNSFNTTSTSEHIAINKELERLEPLRDRHAERHRALADLNGKIRHFLELLPPDAALDDAKAVKIKLKPGETHRQAVARLRGEIAKLIADQGNVQRAGLPVAELKRQAKQWIADRAMKGRPSITAHASRFDVQFTSMVPDTYSPTLDTLALIAWFDPERLETKLNALIDEMPKPKLALTPAEKADRLASIASQLLDLERLEIAHIDAAQDDGTIIPNRADIDPQALLGIVVSRSKANAA